MYQIAYCSSALTEIQKFIDNMDSDEEVNIRLSQRTTSFPFFGPPVTRSPHARASQSLQPQDLSVNGAAQVPTVELDKASLLARASGQKLGTGGDKPEAKWPRVVSCQTSGDVIIGGLMMVHERSDKRTCGKIMPQGG